MPLKLKLAYQPNDLIEKLLKLDILQNSLLLINLGEPSCKDLAKYCENQAEKIEVAKASVIERLIQMDVDISKIVLGEQE